MVAGRYFMWEVMLAALCGKFLLEKKKATETERKSAGLFLNVGKTSAIWLGNK